MKENLLQFTNRIYGYHISEELDRLRNEFCPSNGYFHCAVTCPTYRRYLVKGLSCNGALNQYPEECRQLIEQAGRNEYASTDEK